MNTYKNFFNNSLSVQKSIIGIVGVRGVGKTSLISSICEKTSDLVYSIYMSEELKKYSLAQTQKKFFENTIEQRDRLRHEFGKNLINVLQEQNGPILLDLHLTDIREGQRKIIQPESLLKIINRYIFLDASDETILSRRKSGETRGRSLDITSITQERTAELTALKYIVNKFQSSYQIFSAEGKIHDLKEKISNKLHLSETSIKNLHHKRIE